MLAEGFERMTQTSSRIELTSILVDILKKTPKSMVSHVAYLTQGKLCADFEGIEIGMAEKTAIKALEKAFGIDTKRAQQLLRTAGDLGDVAAKLSSSKVQQLFFNEKLTVEKVYETLRDIATTSGAGSSLSRINKLTMLLASSTSVEAKFLVRFVTGKMRLGVADFTVLDALAVAFTDDKKNREELESAYNLTSDLGFVADLLANHGIKAVKRVKVTAGRPVRPMLAERMPSAESILKQMGNQVSAEYKLDGERVQAHKTKDGKITLYSRRLEQITAQYSDVVKSLESIEAKEFIVEGEVVAIDKNGKYLPFQELMHRRRKYDLAEAMAKYPVVINLFDALLIDGMPKIDEPYKERRRALEALYETTKDKKRVMLVPAKKVTTPFEIDALMEDSLAAGCEGLVVKDHNSSYKAGARGYAWIKFKPEYQPNVRDTVDLVIVGANHGMGRRTGVYGAYLLAAYDRDEDVFRTTTKVGTGFSDLDLQKITNMLEPHKVHRKSPRVDARVDSEVWFEPKIVIEILASEITLSPIYTAGLGLIRKDSGFALRFPKFTGKLRDDKAPEDATTTKELLEIYEKQVRHVKAVKKEGKDK